MPPLARALAKGASAPPPPPPRNTCPGYSSTSSHVRKLGESPARSLLDWWLKEGVVSSELVEKPTEALQSGALKLDIHVGDFSALGTQIEVRWAARRCARWAVQGRCRGALPAIQGRSLCPNNSPTAGKPCDGTGGGVDDGGAAL